MYPLLFSFGLLLSRGVTLTCCHLANQNGVQFDDRAEGVFTVRCRRQDLTVTLEDQFIILFLQQHQNVLQQQSVEICRAQKSSE